MTSSSNRFVRLEELMPVISESLRAGQTVSFSPRGVSMLPMLRQGIDSVELSSVTGKLKKYDLPLYRRDDGHYVLHRIVDVGEYYTCIGDNQFEYEHFLRHDQMLAVVTAFTRDGKRVEVDAFTYKVYCRIWCGTRSIRRHWRRLRSLLGRIKRRLF